MVVSHPVGAGNGTWILWKSSLCSASTGPSLQSHANTFSKHLLCLSVVKSHVRHLNGMLRYNAASGKVKSRPPGTLSLDYLQWLCTPLRANPSSVCLDTGCLSHPPPRLSKLWVWEVFFGGLWWGTDAGSDLSNSWLTWWTGSLLGRAGDWHATVILPGQAGLSLAFRRL